MKLGKRFNHAMKGAGKWTGKRFDNTLNAVSSMNPIATTSMIFVVLGLGVVAYVCIKK